MKKEKKITVLSTAVIAAVLAIVAVVSVMVQRDVQSCTGLIYRGNTEEKRMALMCNVYWGNEYIEPMLDILNQYGVKITFFIGGSWARDNEDLLKKIADNGHEIGNHGYYHYNHSQLTAEKSKENIAKNHELIRDWIGVEMTLFAPPSGDFNNATVQQAEELGYRTVLWTIDTIDWRDTDVDVLVSRVWKKRQNGALVLMRPTAQTVKALAIFLRELTQDGYEITTVGNIIT